MEQLLQEKRTNKQLNRIIIANISKAKKKESLILHVMFLKKRNASITTESQIKYLINFN